MSNKFYTKYELFDKNREGGYQDMGPTEFHSDTLILTDLSCCHPLRSVTRIMK